MNISEIYFFPFKSLFAVSGGVDSMALLHLAMKKLPHEEIIVAHFNHGLRGANSDADEVLVRDFCTKNNLTFFSEKKDISSLAKAEKSSIEATARKYRYQFLQKIFRENDCAICYTAHHLDDRIETAIFNLIRGTKFRGLNALKQDEIFEMENSENFFRVHRPFFGVSKNVIQKYAKRVKIPYREDESNADISLQRNFVRHKILPKFEKINSEYRDALEDFLEYTYAVNYFQESDVKNWLAEQAEKYAKKREKFQEKFDAEIEIIFSISDFEKGKALFQMNVLEYLYHTKNNGNFGLSSGLLEELLRFVTEGKNSFGQKIVKNLHLERRGDFVLVFR